MRMGKSLHSALVWLAVIATPVAAVPRIACVCPDGKVKPRSGDCCLKDRTVPSPSVAQPSPKACCKSGHASGGVSPTSVTAPRCHTTLADSTDAVINPQTTLPDDSVSGSALPHPPDQLPNRDTSPTVTTSKVTNGFDPPPTDRVVVYCHFVI
jgi:hypothetical protein